MYHQFRVIGAMREELARVEQDPPYLLKICCGVGKVNAALAAARICNLAMTSYASYDVILIGTSGAADPSLEVGDVIVATDTLFHDVDVTALGFAPGQIPYADRWQWKSDASLYHAAFTAARAAGCRTLGGRVVTGDRFVGDPLDVARIRETFGASAIDMETAGVAMAVEQSIAGKRGRIRWCSIRVISDRADKSAAADFPAFLPRAAETIGKIVKELVTILG